MLFIFINPALSCRQFTAAFWVFLFLSSFLLESEAFGQSDSCRYFKKELGRQLFLPEWKDTVAIEELISLGSLKKIGSEDIGGKSDSKKALLTYKGREIEVIVKSAPLVKTAIPIGKALGGEYFTSVDSLDHAFAAYTFGKIIGIPLPPMVYRKPSLEESTLLVSKKMAQLPLEIIKSVMGRKILIQYWVRDSKPIVFFSPRDKSIKMEDAFEIGLAREREMASRLPYDPIAEYYWAAIGIFNFLINNTDSQSSVNKIFSTRFESKVYMVDYDQALNAGNVVLTGRIFPPVFKVDHQQVMYIGSARIPDNFHQKIIEFKKNIEGNSGELLAQFNKALVDFPEKTRQGWLSQINHQIEQYIKDFKFWEPIKTQNKEETTHVFF